MADIPFSVPPDMPTREALDRQADLNARRIAHLTARLTSSRIELAQLQADAARRAAVDRAVASSPAAPPPLLTPAGQATYAAATSQHGPCNFTPIPAEVGAHSPNQIRPYAARQGEASARSVKVTTAAPQRRKAVGASSNAKACESRVAVVPSPNAARQGGGPGCKTKNSVKARDRSLQKPAKRVKHVKVKKDKAQLAQGVATSSVLQKSPSVPTSPRTPRQSSKRGLPVSPVTPSRPGRAQGYKCLGMYSEEALRAARMEEARRKAEKAVPDKLSQIAPASSSHSVSESLLSSLSGDGSGAMSSCSLSSDGAGDSLSAALNTTQSVLETYWSSDVPDMNPAEAHSSPVDASLDCFPGFPPEMVGDSSFQAFQKDIEELESFSLSAVVPNQTVEPFDDILV